METIFFDDIVIIYFVLLPYLRFIFFFCLCRELYITFLDIFWLNLFYARTFLICIMDGCWIFYYVLHGFFFGILLRYETGKHISSISWVFLHMDNCSWSLNILTIYSPSHSHTPNTHIHRMGFPLELLFRIYCLPSIAIYWKCVGRCYLPSVQIKL